MINSWLLLLLLPAFAFGALDSSADIPDTLPLKAPAPFTSPIQRNVLSQLAGRDMISERPGVIRGLLVAPRASCQPGDGACKTGGGCCPLGGDCCSDGSCCDSGQWCYAKICCLRSQDGCANKACCEPGETCCSDGCYAAGESCCSGGGGCPAGSYCVTGGCCLDGEVCGGSSDPGSGGSTNTPTTKPPSGPGTTETTATHKTTTTSNGNSNPTQTSTETASPAFTTVPAAPAGSQNVIIDVITNLDISWTGEWVTVNSSCSSGKNAKSCSGSDGEDDTGAGTMMYSFSGSSVYVSVASNNVEYSIFIDDDSTFYSSSGTDADDIAAPRNCTYGWSRTDLSVGTHLLYISILGPPLSKRTNKRDFEAPWSFELQNFVITQSNAEAASDGTGSSKSTLPTAAGGGAGAGGGALSAASGNFVPWPMSILTIVAGVWFALS